MAKQDESATAAMRNLPSVDALLKDAALENCAGVVGRKVVVDVELKANDEVCVTGEVLCIQAPEDFIK